MKIIEISEDLPKGWVWTKLGELGHFINGDRGKNYPNKTALVESGIPFINAGHIQDGIINLSEMNYITEERFNLLGSGKVEPNDILYCLRGSLGKTAIVKNITTGAIASSLVIIRPYDYSKHKYLYCFLVSPLGDAEIRKHDNGSAQPNLSAKSVKNYSIPFPPLNEQKRIVAKIEALQTRSTAVQEELEAIKPLLNQFRQSVLAAAFRGDLTKDWREQNKHTPWEHTTLESLIKDRPRNGYSPKAVDYPTEVKSFSLSATTSGVFKPEYFKYIDKDIEQDSYLWLKPGDVLIQRSNTLEYVGTSAIYTGQFGDFIYPDTVMKIQVDEVKTTNKFIHYSLSNKKTRQYFKDNATGTAGNMPKINQKTVMNTPVSLPSIEEQEEIVRRIESLFKLADSIEQQYQQAEVDLETLNQSILAKAFRGELVPQDPNDEPASVLLERIREERDRAKAAAKKSKSKKKSSSKKQNQQLDIPGM